MRFTRTASLVLLAFCGGCEWLNQEQPADDPGLHSAIVYGVVTGSDGLPGRDIKLYLYPDYEIPCTASGDMGNLDRVVTAASNAQGRYRAEVMVEATLPSSCVRVSTSSTLRAFVSAGPVRFGRTPLDSLQINVTLGP